jgi:hypothetical protein
MNTSTDNKKRTIILAVLTVLLLGTCGCSRGAKTPIPTLTSTAVLTSAPTSTPITTPSATPTQPPTPTDTPTPTPAVAAVVLASSASLRPGADTWWYPRQTLPAGTYLELIGYDPNFPDWVYVRTVGGESSGWIQIADLKINRELSDLPRVTPVPTLTRTPHTPPLTPTLVGCEGGPLRLDAWDVDKVRTSGGWTATVFVEGHGGDCVYTYAWEGEVKGGPMSGSMTFELSSAGYGTAIVGNVSVTSAGETVTVGLFIKPP